MSTGLPADARHAELGIAFFDLERFARWAQGRSDEVVATLLQAFYDEACRRLPPAGMRIVKFMGDGGLGVFPPEETGAVLRALHALAGRIAAYAEPLDLDTDLSAKVHVGTVLEGTFGADDLARYDVLGASVNETALLPGRGIVLSPTAYERLPPSDREAYTWDEEDAVWRA